jgi:NO-binding membrane sensor protein with MHYT domain
MSFSTVWQHYSIIISLLASVAGLGLLFLPQLLKQTETLPQTERTLMMMSFTYWGVHCVAVLAQKLPPQDWEGMLMSLKMMAIMTFFLTFSSILSLPLSHFAASQQLEEE